MCGIGGIAYSEPKISPQPELLKAMGQTMTHRGPDDQGIYRGQGIGLCFQRLSIIDLQGGHQPLSNEKGTIWLVCNGEIYNYLQLRQELKAMGHVFRTDSDAEVIVHLYEEYGTACLKKLHGMFALALWDQKRRQLMLARDRIGIKPLYYTLLPGKLAFASEIRALLSVPGVKALPNLEALDSYLAFRFVPAPLTLFQGIVKLEPGHCLTYCRGKLDINRYWDLPKASSFAGDEEEAASKLLSLLQDAVTSHLQSDAPLGMFLSGGLDSSTILALASQIKPDRLQTFSLGFTRDNQPHQDFWELDAARQLAKHYGTEHHELEVTPREIPGALAEMIWQLEEPLGDPTMIPLHFISRKASGKVKVILSGEGADELFAGYEVYQEPWQRSVWERLSGPFQQRLSASLADSWPTGWPGKNFFLRAALPVEAWYRGVGSTFSENEKAGLYAKSLSQASLGFDFKRRAASCFPSGQDLNSLEKMLYFDTKYWLADDTLIKSDKLTMAQSLELRVPFLDDSMIEFAASLPSHFKVKGKSLKYVLKKAVGGILPPEVLQRPKIGFTAPITSWVNGELHSFASSLLNSEQFHDRRYFRPEVVQGLLNNTRPHPVHGRQIFALMVLEIWHRLFVDSNSNSTLSQLAYDLTEEENQSWPEIAIESS
ncbi:MAG: asparagine synthase (glutamine-hydrolyzing) [Syntrophomonas sp.]|nr:asparagine synthase (glutamine-hydrolyzing) [Syntrophomonas sp.]